MICPFIFSQRPDYGKGDRVDCTTGCELWVESEEMCSFRLLADKEADFRKRVRDAGQEIGTKEKPRKTKKRRALDCNCRRCGTKGSVEIIQDPLNPSMMKDKLHCFACGRTWPVPEDTH